MQAANGGARGQSPALLSESEFFDFNHFDASNFKHGKNGVKDKNFDHG